MAKDLFTSRGDSFRQINAPLADRLRPKSLDEFVGQGMILAEGRLLRRAIAADKVGSLILYGPPGVGKTTLAKIIARNTRSNFEELNAVLAGVKDIRIQVDQAKERLDLHGLRTILFIDEVHRFNSVQQDALLPWVENGTLTLIGATTENPYFEVNKALVSRSRIFRLLPLEDQDLHQLLLRALSDCEKGYGKHKVSITKEAANHLVDVSNGDARSLLNALELAVESTPRDSLGSIEIDLSIAEESIQQRAVLYDKQGDSHFDTVSAFIKSLRGSDPDAALFWLARMLEAGENPRFIFRRMLISASEDIGLADPQAIVVVESCAGAFERVGLPEGYYSLAQAAVYLACTDKSNSLLGFFEAQKVVQNAHSQDVPSHLRDGNRDRDAFGDGVGYLYPHSFAENWVAQQYLPNALQEEVFWKPTSHGWEGERRIEFFSRRAAQLAAASETINENPFFVSSGPETSQMERWAHNQIAREAFRLQRLEEKLWEGFSWERHARVLVLGGSSLLWVVTPLRKVPEGGVTLLVDNIAQKKRLSTQLDILDPIFRPQIISTNSKVPFKLKLDLKFECVGGRLIFDQICTEENFLNWDLITKHSISGADMRLLITYPMNGPAEALYKIVDAKDFQLLEKDMLEDLINIERDYFKYINKENIFLNYLNNLGWSTNVTDSQEAIEVLVDEKLEERWTAQDSRYIKFLVERTNKEVINLFKKLVSLARQRQYKQNLSHHIISGRLN